jgi:bifunctional non-homologous end joining protein LigD
MTLRRYPHGVADLSFFAKHAPERRPDWLHTREVVSHSSRARTPGAAVRYLVIDDLPALIWAVNLAAIELHVPMWHFPAFGLSNAPSTPIEAVDGATDPGSPEAGNDPDLLVFDLDPGGPATIVECCRVAEALRPVLEGEGLRPLPKTSGGKGLQLYATVSGLTAEQASDLALGFAQRLERELPRLVVSRMAKSARSGKVLIDWSQNNGSKTTIAPYSLRAREHPTVSTPVSWDEVAACRQVADLVFTATDVLARVEAHGDLFAPLTSAAS